MAKTRFKLPRKNTAKTRSERTPDESPRGKPKARDPKTGRVSGGNPGNRGGGRKPKDFIAMCQRLSYKAMRRKVRRVLRDDRHPYFMSALKLASEYGWGRPKETVALEGKLTLEHLVAGANDDGEWEQEREHRRSGR